MRSILAWGLPAVLLAGVSVASVRVADVEGEPGTVERMLPLERGTTWVYRTETNGEPSGLRTSQVVGGALMADGRPATVVEDRYEDFLGGGPVSGWDYVALRRGRSFLVGSRFAADYEDRTPPAPSLVPPLETGQSWSWEGKAGDRPGSYTTTVEKIGSRTVAGRRLTGCRFVHTDNSYVDSAGEEGTSTIDTWVCPGVGVVSSREEIVGGDLVFEQELVAFRAAGISLGTPTPIGTIEPEPGESPGVDPARTSAVPGDLRTDALAWSETRKAALDFAPVGREGLLVMAEEDGWVSATDTHTGAVLWRVQAEGRVTAPPVLAGPLVLVGDSEKSLLALDAADGRARWIRRLPDLVAGPPVPAGDRLLVAGEDRVVRALDLEDGEVRWETRFLGLISQPMALLGDRVLVGQLPGEVTAVSVRDGEELWSAALETPLLSGPVARDGLVVVGDDQGLVYGFDAGTGETRWIVNPDGFVDQAAALGPGSLVLIAGRVVQARDPADGSLRWEARLHADVAGPPLIVGDEVVTLTDVGELQRFALVDGVPRGSLQLAGPAPEFEIGADYPLQFLGDSLVATIKVAGPWPFGLVLAFPTSAAARSDGVRPPREIRPAPAPPIGPPALDDRGDVLLSGADDRVWRLPSAGPPIQLLRTGDTPPSFAIPVGDLVLSQRGPELVAVPRGGGEPRWTFPMGDPFVGTAPLVVGDTVVVPIRGEGLAGVDLATGQARWVETIAGQGTSSPVLLPGGDVAYGVGSLVRLDPATGAVRWRVPAVDTFGPLGVGDDAISELGFHDNQAVLLSVEAATGAVRWERPLQPSLLAGPAAAGGVVVASDPQGAVTAFDAGTGEPRWSIDLRMPSAGSPLVLGDLVVVAALGRNEDVLQRDFRLAFLRAADGRYVGAFEPNGVAHSLAGFAVAGDRLLVPAVTDTNAVFILELGWP